MTETGILLSTVYSIYLCTVGNIDSFLLQLMGCPLNV